ncbi:hypothetical protein B446_35493 (plasmid) [Streptomyces collinus Tu 365]|uniref:Uncharacterized protein n=1 Tax=Streptomyces collinus (strain DSM 40733 / Tue 365) TaxID=1214242 RepID=S5VSJ2_STRC3|nr:hypothetical protein B446_35493 [Streptomyces collinus Tu 365]
MFLLGCYPGCPSRVAQLFVQLLTLPKGIVTVGLGVPKFFLERCYFLGETVPNELVLRSLILQIFLNFCVLGVCCGGRLFESPAPLLKLFPRSVRSGDLSSDLFYYLLRGLEFPLCFFLLLPDDESMVFVRVLFSNVVVVEKEIGVMHFFSDSSSRLLF